MMHDLGKGFRQKILSHRLAQGSPGSLLKVQAHSEARMEFLASPVRQARMRILAVEQDRFLQTIEIGNAIWTAVKVPFDFPALGRIELLVQVVTDVTVNVPTFDCFLLHDVMYSFNCSRRKTRARRNLDFTAGTDRFRILAASSADCPSTSRKMNTIR